MKTVQEKTRSPHQKEPRHLPSRQVFIVSNSFLILLVRHLLLLAWHLLLVASYPRFYKSCFLLHSFTVSPRHPCLEGAGARQGTTKAQPENTASAGFKCASQAVKAGIPDLPKRVLHFVRKSWLATWMALPKTWMKLQLLIIPNRR